MPLALRRVADVPGLYAIGGGTVTVFSDAGKDVVHLGIGVVDVITDLRPRCQCRAGKAADGGGLNFQNGKFTYQRVNGGLSGKAIKPIALRAISAIRQNVDIPIIGMGGIYCLDDLFEFIAVGADAFQIGTANFTYPTIAEDLVMQLAEFMQGNNFRSFEELKMKIREDMKHE